MSTNIIPRPKNEKKKKYIVGENLFLLTEDSLLNS